jgi:hypothetical protein
MPHLLGSRQAAEITVNDDAVKAVVDKGQQVAEQLREQFHGHLSQPRQGSQENNSRKGCHCEEPQATKQSRSGWAPSPRDCFASLAMTASGFMDPGSAALVANLI